MTITSTSKEPPADIEFGKLWTLEDTFTSPEFRLLYVPPKDEDDKMTIITPSKHEPSYVPDRKFYALSHLWGTDPKDNLWDVSDFIIDEDGTTVEPIPMRKEKRDTLLELLQDNPGYWWIDVLCCRTDTPPIIMRGVYGCCEKCFAMIDCPPKAIEYFSDILPRSELHDESEEIVDLPLPLLMEGCKHVRDIWKCRWFSRVWTMQELALPSSVMLLSETCVTTCYVSADSFHARQFRGDRFDADRYASADSLDSPQYYFWNRFYQLLKLFDKGSEGESARALQKHLSILRDVAHEFHGVEESSEFGRFQNLGWLLTQFSLSERSCYFAEDYVYGVLGILGWDIPRLNSMQDLWDRFLFNLQRVSEKAFSESIGIFLVVDPECLSSDEDESTKQTRYDAMREHCLENFQLRISKEARSCPLSEACTLADVYQDLMYIEARCGCFDCDAVFKTFLIAYREYFAIVFTRK